MPQRLLRTSCVLLTVSLLAACGPRSERDAADAPAPPPAQAGQDQSPGTASAPLDTPAAAGASSSGSTQPALAVNGEGLRVFEPSTGAASPIAFGRPQADVLAALERLRGAAGRGVNADCGAGPVDYANWADGLSLVFQDARFAGWGLDGRAAGAIGTASGIGPGSTRADLDAAYGEVTVTRTSLGQEFAAGDLYGVLDGAGPTAKITDMWSGVNCVAR